MNIKKDMVVTLDYNAKDSDGNVVDEGENSLSYIHGGYGGVFVPVEAALEGKKKGDSIKVILDSKNSFGPYIEELVTEEERSQFDEQIFVGEQFEGPSMFEENETMLYAITNITEEKVTLDANHPLAGMEVSFEATVLDVREATKEEISEGSVL